MSVLIYLKLIVFERETHCYICEKTLKTKNSVIDLDNFTVKSGGLAHTKCSLKLKEPLLIPMIALNFQV